MSARKRVEDVLRERLTSDWDYYNECLATESLMDDPNHDNLNYYRQRRTEASWALKELAIALRITSRHNNKLRASDGGKP